MTQFAPSPSNPYIPQPTRTRLRWDNLAVLFAILAVLGGVVTSVFAQSSPKPKQAQVTAPAEATALSTDATGAGSTTAITEATLEDAASLVAEARDYIGQGRWEEAADRLASVDPNLRNATDADAAQRELEAAQASWNRLDAQLRSQVDAKDWNAARATLVDLADIAPLGDEQLTLQDQVDEALATASDAKRPKPAAAAAKPATATAATATATAQPAAAATAAPAASTNTKPAAAATTSKPAASNPKPAATTTKPAPGGGTTATLGNVTITVPAGADDIGAGDVDAAQLEQLLGMVGAG